MQTLLLKTEIAEVRCDLAAVKATLRDERTAAASDASPESEGFSRTYVIVERIAFTLEEGAVKFACMKAVMCRKGLVLGWEEVVSINLLMQHLRIPRSKSKGGGGTEGVGYIEYVH